MSKNAESVSVYIDMQRPEEHTDNKHAECHHGNKDGNTHPESRCDWNATSYQVEDRLPDVSFPDPGLAEVVTGSGN